MTRSKFSTKAVLLATGIGLSIAAFSGSQPAAAQSYTCPAGTAYDLTYGCTTPGWDAYGYYYGDPYGAYGTVRHWGAPLDHHHGFGHGMEGTVGVDRGFSAAHYGGGGFGHGMGMGIAGGHNIGGGFGHGMAGGFGHGGGGGHR